MKKGKEILYKKEKKGFLLQIKIIRHLNSKCNQVFKLICYLAATTFPFIFMALLWEGCSESEVGTEGFLKLFL